MSLWIPTIVFFTIVYGVLQFGGAETPKESVKDAPIVQLEK